MTNPRPPARRSLKRRQTNVLEKDDFPSDRAALIEEIKQLRATVHIYQELVRLAEARSEAVCGALSMELSESSIIAALRDAVPSDRAALIEEIKQLRTTVHTYQDLVQLAEARSEAVSGALSMELSESSVVAGLLDGLERQPRPRAPRGRPDLERPSESKRVSTPRHCTCGTCAFCQDNARWERIFQERFADPEYYKRRGVKHVSSLSDPG
jgi:hypothetical protein